MNHIHSLTRKERDLLLGGALLGVLLTAFLTWRASDHIATFIAAIGAIGQVGIALALYFVNRAQWKLQEHLAEDEVRQQAERHRLARQAALDGVREEILWFYRSRDVAHREECYDKMCDHLFQLKHGLGLEASDSIRKFVRFSSEIVVATEDEEGRKANGRRIHAWRDSANHTLELVGAAPIDFGKRRD